MSREIDESVIWYGCPIRPTRGAVRGSVPSDPDPSPTLEARWDRSQYLDGSSPTGISFRC